MEIEHSFFSFYTSIFSQALIEAGDWKRLELKARALQLETGSIPLLLWEQLTDMVWKRKETPEELIVDLLQVSRQAAVTHTSRAKERF